MLPEPDLSGFTAAQIEFAIAAWPMRTAEELRSARVYRALARACRPVMPEPWPARFDEVVREELAHARLCEAVGRRLGAAPAVHDPSRVQARLADLVDDEARTIALLAVEVAMGETVSMTMFRAGRRDATEPLTRYALDAIVRDETRHQQLGWDGLEALLPLLSEPRREALDLELARSLGAFERQIALPVLKRLESGEPFDPAYAALGVIAPESRVEAFYDSIEKLVIPHLARLGLDGQRAWDRRYRA
jgi:hypothetical protein